MTTANESLTSLKALLAQLDAQPLSPEARLLVQQALEQSDALIQAQANAEQEAVQEKGKFVSVVTHELRLPLTSIKGYTDLLRQGIVGPINDQQKNFLNVIRNNVERMSVLIANLSDMSYVETGRLKLNVKSTAPAAAVEEALLTLQAKISEKNLTLQIDMPADLPEVQADSARLIQVLGNLINNALMYTPGGGSIHISARFEGGFVRFEIRDSGIGISEADQEKLFSPFFRSDDEAVREQQGWGLALHVSQLLIQAQGGEIGVHSQLKAGSNFWFTLPVQA